MMCNWMLLVLMIQFVRESLTDICLDLELLAQQKANSCFQSSNQFSHVTPEEEIFTGLKHQEAPLQKSRFFDCQYSS
jgi:hypothetical protein